MWLETASPCLGATGGTGETPAVGLIQVQCSATLVGSKCGLQEAEGAAKVVFVFKSGDQTGQGKSKRGKDGPTKCKNGRIPCISDQVWWGLRVWGWNEKLQKCGDLVTGMGGSGYGGMKGQKGQRSWGAGCERGRVTNAEIFQNEGWKLGWTVPQSSVLWLKDRCRGWRSGGSEDGLGIKGREASYCFTNQTDPHHGVSFHSYLNTQCLERGEFLNLVCRTKEINFEELNKGLLVFWHESPGAKITRYRNKKKYRYNFRQITYQKLQVVS